VTLLRGQFLTTGPLALIAMCYAIAAPPSGSHATPLLPAINLGHSAGALNVDCRRTAANLEQQLPNAWHVLVKEPFVLAGDCSIEQLTRYHQETIAPTSLALSIQYFDAHPTWPVTIILCSSDQAYGECNRSLGERERTDYAGIYSRSEHRVIVNVATGEGTLAHELTHALAHVDFPELPEWVDEGLASLHEECEFSADGVRLIGLQNWRAACLKAAMQRGTLQSIVDLAGGKFAKTDAAIDYAHSRYFCLYLQQRNLLEPFYRKCRSNSKTDHDGITSLTQLMGTDDLRKIDAQFSAWLRTLKSD
jgi:hypothetical protein